MNIHIPQQDRLSKIVKMWADGLTCQEIADRTGMTRGAIASLGFKHRDLMPARMPKKKDSDLLLSETLRLRKEGMKIAAISEKLNVPAHRLYRLIRSAGHAARRVQHVKPIDMHPGTPEASQLPYKTMTYTTATGSRVTMPYVSIIAAGKLDSEVKAI